MHSDDDYFYDDDYYYYYDYYYNDYYYYDDVQYCHHDPYYYSCYEAITGQVGEKGCMVMARGCITMTGRRGSSDVALQAAFAGRCSQVLRHLCGMGEELEGEAGMLKCGGERVSFTLTGNFTCDAATAMCSSMVTLVERRWWVLWVVITWG